MKVAYIAGPFRAKTAWQVELNIRRAEEMAYQVWMCGVAALCPHTNTRFFDGEGSAELWLEGTMELMRRCDVVVVCEGWEKSTGTLAEIAEAERLGIPVVYDAEGFHMWGNGQ